MYSCSSSLQAGRIWQLLSIRMNKFGGSEEQAFYKLTMYYCTGALGDNTNTDIRKSTTE